MEGLSGKVRAEVTVDMAKTMFALGRQEEACALLQNLVMENHEDIDLMNQVQGVLEANEMEVDDAKEMVEKSRQEVVATNNEGVLLARDGKFAEAIELLRNAVQRVPNNVVMINNLCGVLIATMKRDGRDEDMVMEAKMLIDRVGELSPGHAKYYEYMNALTQLGSIEAAPPPPAEGTEAAPEPMPSASQARGRA
jgi:predicted Zn-dependent protease